MAPLSYGKRQLFVARDISLPLLPSHCMDVQMRSILPVFPLPIGREKAKAGQPVLLAEFLVPLLLELIVNLVLRRLAARYSYCPSRPAAKDCGHTAALLLRAARVAQYAFGAQLGNKRPRPLLGIDEVEGGIVTDHILMTPLKPMLPLLLILFRVKA